MRASDMIVPHDKNVETVWSGRTTLHSQGARQKNLFVGGWQRKVLAATGLERR